MGVLRPDGGALRLMSVNAHPDSIERTTASRTHPLRVAIKRLLPQGSHRPTLWHREPRDRETARSPPGKPHVNLAPLAWRRTNPFQPEDVDVDPGGIVRELGSAGEGRPAALTIVSARRS